MPVLWAESGDELFRWVSPASLLTFQVVGIQAMVLFGRRDK